MLRDRSHVFLKMWSAEPWLTRARDQTDCWWVQRDTKDTLQDVYDYFDDARDGAYCDSNWYTGNHGELGDAGRRPEFTGPAPALFGFDDAIDQYCGPRARGGRYSGHAGVCVNANLNILSLYGHQVPYNTCRNLEWQVCSAKGLLPGQASKKIVFAKAPKDLDPHPRGGRPVGRCGGWRPRGTGSCEGGYATDSVFFLEVCLFHMLCRNSDELWVLERGDEFVCDFSDEAFGELQNLLTSIEY